MARVGLLEDNIRISKLCATMLNYIGHDVMVYATANECLSALDVLDQPLARVFPRKGIVDSGLLPIDVLILDLHLPSMTGLELLTILRSCTRTRSLPLIFCTAATGLEIAQAFAIAPNATLVEKPFRLQALVSAISEVIPAVF